MLVKVCEDDVHSKTHGL